MHSTSTFLEGPNRTGSCHVFVEQSSQKINAGVGVELAAKQREEPCSRFMAARRTCSENPQTPKSQYVPRS